MKTPCKHKRIQILDDNEYICLNEKCGKYLHNPDMKTYKQVEK